MMKSAPTSVKPMLWGVAAASQTEIEGGMIFGQSLITSSKVRTIAAIYEWGSG